MASKPPSREEAEHCIKVVQDALAQNTRNPIIMAARALGIAESTLKSRIGAAYGDGGQIARWYPDLRVDWSTLKRRKAPDYAAYFAQPRQYPDDNEPLYADDEPERRAERGELGFSPVLPGYHIKKTSTQLGPEGELQREWVQQARAPSGKFELPEGHRIKGISALLDADGRTIQEWVKTANDARGDALIDAVREAFSTYQGAAVVPAPPVHCDDDLLTVYVIADAHLGLYSWSRETGSDYDLEIAERILIDAMGRLVASAPSSSRAIVLNLGDFFHADSKSNRTEKSGHALDVDTRWPKVLATGVKLYQKCIDLALAKHKRVIARCLNGNHDDHSSFALAVALGCFYDGHDRVTVDMDPSKFFFHKHGKVLISATHGDMVKPAQMPGTVAAMQPSMWGQTVFRYGYQGHVHSINKMASEGGGMVVETFQTLAGKDSWHSAMGYCANRSMTAITHHAEHGEYVRNIISYNQSASLKS